MKKLFNDNWQFLLEETGRELSQMMKKTDWFNIEVPHDWLINDTRDLYKTSEGWYRKAFTVDSETLSKVNYLMFDGVYMNSEVFINGKSVGTWKNGYTSFSFDISGFLTLGENVILVKVLYQSPNTRWYSGAGIFRNVWLRTAEKTHILNNGVYVSTKKRDDKFSIRVEVSFTGEIGKNDTIRNTLFNMDGVEEVIEGLYDTENGYGYYETQKPVLWDVLHPYVYKLKTDILKDGNVVDSVIQNIGFKTIEFTTDEGFKLNGRTLKLKGVCMHHDLGALGSAYNVNAARRQIEILKGMGVNTIRTSHNPPAPEFMDLCDEMGIMVDNEFTDMWELSKTTYDYARFFKEWYKKDVESWIKRDRNHPSLIMWSIGNEIYDTHASERGLEVAIALKKEVLRHDPYENAGITIGSNYMFSENAQKVSDELKLAGYNYAERLYDEHHSKYKDWFIYGSETASTVRSRGIYHFPLSESQLIHDTLQCSDIGNSVVDWGGHTEKTLVDDRDRKFCGGQYVWTGFDYIGEPTPYSTKNSYFGIIDTAGFPKSSYYAYSAVWNDTAEPYVKLFPNWDYNDGQIIDIISYSNMREVELFVNGESYGKKIVDAKKDEVLHATWQAVYKAGEIYVNAYDENGTVVATDRKATPLEPKKIVIKADKTPLFANGTDMAFVEIAVVDGNGYEVDNARNRIKVETEGGMRLAGLDNGDSTDYDSYKSDNRKLFSGKLLAMFKTTFTAGDTIIKFSSVGLESAELKLTSLPCENAPVGISIADENVFPAYKNEYYNEVPVRKISLKADRQELTKEENRSNIYSKLHPENATHRDIIWKAQYNNGVDASNIVDIIPNDEGASVIAKGDGEFRIKAISRNDKKNPEVISELEYKISGLGDPLRTPYKFNSTWLFDYSNYPVEPDKSNLITGIEKRTVIGYTNMNFGETGTDKIKVFVGNCWDYDVVIDIYEGIPDEGGEKLGTVSVSKNGKWRSFEANECTLSRRITGTKTISFVFDKNNFFGGFECTDLRAFEKISVLDNDGLYGDMFEVNENRVEKIGNNVTISFKTLSFGEKGANKITIFGHTSNSVNTISLRGADCETGVEETMLLEFKKSDDYTSQTFDIKKLTGKKDVNFVFLPGSNFDFEWFKFE